MNENKPTTKEISKEDEKIIDKFSKELSDLLKKNKIQQYAGIFIVAGKPILSYFPDDITAAKLLKNAHATCRNNVIQSMGG
jgi:hypothetical protein